MSSEGFNPAADAPHRADEFGKTFESEVLAVQRYQHGVRGNQRIQGEQTERRGAVDEDVLEARPKRIEHALQTTLALEHRNHLDLCACQIPVGGHQMEIVDPRREDEGIRHGSVHVHQGFVSGAARRTLPLEAHAAREVSLRVNIDEENRTAFQSQ
jgi:hypothetical protein